MTARALLLTATAVVAVLLMLWLWPREQSSPAAAPKETASATPTAPVSAAPVQPPPSEPPPTVAPKASAPPDLSALDTPLPEDEYLQELKELSISDKVAALTLAEKGDAWYSDHGRNAEARRAMRVTLLVDLNRMSEARALTRRFIAQYPDSPYRRLVQGVTGIHPRPSPGQR